MAHGEHAEIAEQLPNLQKYAVSVPTRPEHSEFDGVIGTHRVPIACRALLDNVAELYFESEDAMKSAFGSDVGHELQEDVTEFTNMDESPTLYVNEDVRLDETA